MKYVLSLLLIFLTACSLKPKEEIPITCIPENWKYQSEQPAADLHCLWWQEFHDPVLDRYVVDALANNQDLKIAISRVDEYVAKLGITRADFYPQIQGEAEADREKFSTTVGSFPVSTATKTTIYKLLLKASYELDLWGKIRSASEAALAQLLAQVQNRKTVVLTLVTTVVSTYFELRQLDAQLAISKQTLQDRQEEYNLAFIRYNLGLTSLMQVEQATSEVESAQVEVNRLILDIGLKEDLLAILLGKPPEKIQRGNTLDILALPPKVPQSLPSEILFQRPDIQAAEQNLFAANANIGVARARFFPEISLSAALGTESSTLQKLFKGSSNIWQYGASLLQEIFTGGKLTSQLRLSKAEKITMLHQYQQTILNAFKEVSDAMLSFQIAKEQVSIQENRVKTFQEYFYLANLRYQNGQTDYLNFLDAERRLFNAKLDYEQAKGEVLISYVNLYKTLGGGWIDQADRLSDASPEN